MLIAKKQWHDESPIACYHGYQSFKHGEVDAKTAHEIGVKLAEKMWGDRFQVIVATHLNTDCMHNHFVVNSVSFVDGKHYHDNKKNLRAFRAISDELCREYSLSVIQKPDGRKKPYALYQAEKNGMPTRNNIVRQAIDEAISKSFTLKDFDRLMLQMGYKVSLDSNRKYWTVFSKDWQRPKRMYKLGEEYTNERILQRIAENSYGVKLSQFTQPAKKYVFRFKGTFKGKKKMGGFHRLYLHYCYLLGIFPKHKKQNNARLHYLLKDDLIKMEAIAQETRLLCRNKIDTTEQLSLYKEKLESEISELVSKRKKLYSEKNKPELFEISKRLKFLRKEVRLCKSIETRNGIIHEKISAINAERKDKEYEQRRRCSRTGGANELGRC